MMTEITAPPIAQATSAARVGQRALWNLVLAAVYFGIASVSLAAATEHRVVSSIWPPAGIALFALLRWGNWLAPGAFLGAFALNFTSNTGPVAAAFIGAGDMLEALVGAILIRRYTGTRFSLSRVRDVLAFGGLGGLVSPLIAATIGVATLVLSGGADASKITSLWSIWYSGDAVGILVITPLLLVWSTSDAVAQIHPQRRVEAAVVFVGVAALTDVLFRNQLPIVFALYPLGVWVAWRFGPRGAATATAVVTLVATAHTLSGSGPFTTLSQTANLYALQLFLALFGIKTLLFSAARTEAVISVINLQASERRYRQLAQNLPEGCVVLYDKDLRLLLVEGPAVVTAGFTKEGIEGKRLSDIFEPQHSAALSGPFLAALEGRVVEFEFGYKDHTYLVRVLPIHDPTEKSTLGMAMAVDVTEREVARREAVEGRAQLERLSRLLITAQEDERKRIAREVHDELGQTLTAVKIGLAQTLTRPSRRSSLEDDRRMNTASEVLDRAIGSVQKIVLRLRPGVLDNLGPLAALEHEVQQFREQSGLTVTLELPPEPFTIDGERSTALYRTVQEALTNVLRHADAQHVSITLMATDKEILLQVADDGRGIADAQLTKPRSMGILGMRERAASCGGRLDIFRVSAGGTCLSLRMPRSSNGKHHS